MAVAYVTSHGTATSKTAGTTLTKQPTGTVVVGRTLVLYVTADNLSATTPTFTASDTQGNTWVTLVQGAAVATAGSGVAGAIIASTLTTALATTDTITVTLSGSVTARALAIQEYSGGSTTLRNAGVTAVGTSTAPSVTSNSANSGDLVLGNVAYEDNAGPANQDNDTTNGTWGTYITSFTTGGGATANVALVAQYKVTTGAGAQTYNPTIGAATDWVAMTATLTPAGAATVTRTATGTGNGTAATTHIEVLPRTATGSGTGSATASRVVVRSRTAIGSGSGTATASRLIIRPRTATGSSSSSSTAVASVVGGPIKRTATGTNTSSATATRLVTRFRNASGSGSGTATAISFKVAIRTASSSGAGTGIASPKRLVSVAAIGSGSGSATIFVSLVVKRVAVSAGVGGSIVWSDRLFQLDVPLRLREKRKFFFPPPQKPVGRGKPLQRPRVRW